MSRCACVSIAVLFALGGVTAAAATSKPTWFFIGDAPADQTSGFGMRDGKGIQVYATCDPNKLYVEFDPSATARLVAAELLPHIFFNLDGNESDWVFAYPEMHEVGNHLWVFAATDVQKSIYADLAKAGTIRLKLVGTGFHRATQVFQEIGPLSIDGRSDVIAKFVDRCFGRKARQPN